MVGTEVLPLVNAISDASGTGDKAHPFFHAVASSMAEAWQGIVGDRVAGWRVKNAISVQEKIEKYARSSGKRLDLSRIPESYAFTWFISATEQEDADVQELFAKILIGAVDGDADARQKRNIEILSKFTAIDAWTLKKFAEHLVSKHQDGQDEAGIIVFPDGEDPSGQYEILRAFEFLTSQGLTLLENDYVLTIGSTVVDARRCLYSFPGSNHSGFSINVELTMMGISFVNAIFPELDVHSLLVSGEAV